jgi:hypothetical protein
MSVSSIPAAGAQVTPLVLSPKAAAKPVAAAPAPAAAAAAATDSDGDHDGTVGTKVDVKA